MEVYVEDEDEVEVIVENENVVQVQGEQGNSTLVCFVA